MALIQRLQSSPEATFWPGKIPMNYIYTAGRAGQAFFSKLRDQGKFIGARCEDCDMTYFPPRIFCERCFDRIEGNWVNVKNRGVVHTLAVSHETYDGKPHQEPTIVAFIRLKDTDGGMFHHLGEVDYEDCYIGMPVEAVLQPKNKRKGGILDIKYFRPL